MKKAVNIFAAYILSLTILIGYTGVPIYKMICVEDGHVTVSISQSTDKCNHQPETKDCCKPIEKQHSEPKSCCDFDNSFVQLQESSLVFASQTGTGHILTAITVLFAPIQLTAPSAYTLSANTKTPSLLCRKQNTQSLTQIFRI